MEIESGFQVDLAIDCNDLMIRKGQRPLALLVLFHPLTIINDDRSNLFSSISRGSGWARTSSFFSQIVNREIAYLHHLLSDFFRVCEGKKQRGGKSDMWRGEKKNGKDKL